MKLPKLSIMLIFLFAPTAYSMEVRDKSEDQEGKYDKKALELIHLPKDILIEIINEIFDTGSLKDIRSVMLTNKLLATHTLQSKAKLGKEICNAFNKKLLSFFDPSLINAILPKLIRLIGQDSLAHTLSLLSHEDVLKLLKSILNIDTKNPDCDIRYTLIVLKQLIIQARKRKLDINFESEQGLTLLMWPTTLSAFWLTNAHTYAAYDQILKAGAKINYKNKDGKTFLDMAIPEVKSYVKKRSKMLLES